MLSVLTHAKQMSWTFLKSRMSVSKAISQTTSLGDARVCGLNVIAQESLVLTLV